jgi:hypothetical protein
MRQSGMWRALRQLDWIYKVDVGDSSDVVDWGSRLKQAAWGLRFVKWRKRGKGMGRACAANGKYRHQPNRVRKHSLVGTFYFCKEMNELTNAYIMVLEIIYS